MNIILEKEWNKLGWKVFDYNNKRLVFRNTNKFIKFDLISKEILPFIDDNIYNFAFSLDNNIRKLINKQSELLGW